MKAQYSAQVSGFTLIELMITVAIVGILAMVSAPIYHGYMDRARSAIAVADISRIAKTIDLYAAETGKYPEDLSVVYMDSLLDPWGNPYEYVSVDSVKGKGKLRKDRNLTPLNTDYDLYSKGPDGKSVGPLTAQASHDDIVRAGNGSFVGIAEKY